ncbi:MAG: 16S rRNA (guanine(966)-N(2))-methyltransferase RsmD [Atribacterota bacterium]
MGYLHILGGTMKGRKIITPSGSGVRPMPGAVRKSIFEILRAVIPQKTVYDIFAGSGILGFEALSRGAKRVYFLEKHRKTCALLEENLVACGIEDKGKVLCLDFLLLTHFPRYLEKPEVVFFDPPFAVDCSRVLEKIVQLKSFFQDSLLIIRYPENQNPFLVCPCFWKEDLRKYGESIIFFGYLRKNLV